MMTSRKVVKVMMAGGGGYVNSIQLPEWPVTASLCSKIIPPPFLPLHLCLSSMSLCAVYNRQYDC